MSQSLNLGLRSRSWWQHPLQHAKGTCHSPNHLLPYVACRAAYLCENHTGMHRCSMQACAINVSYKNVSRCKHTQSRALPRLLQPRCDCCSFAQGSIHRLASIRRVLATMLREYLPAGGSSNDLHVGPRAITMKPRCTERVQTRMPQE